jgi:hypothetical protein
MAVAVTGNRSDPAKARRISDFPMLYLFIFIFLIFSKANPCFLSPEKSVIGHRSSVIGIKEPVVGSR